MGHVPAGAIQQDDDDHDIFLSYSRANTDLMLRIKGDLKAEGFRVWIDQTQLKPGTHSWTRAIQQAIDTCGCLVVVLSPTAKASMWVTEEMNYARAQNKTIFGALGIGPPNSALPFGYSTLQCVDLTDDARYASEWQKLVEAIRAELGGATPKVSQPTPAVAPPEPAPDPTPPPKPARKSTPRSPKASTAETPTTPKKKSTTSSTAKRSTSPKPKTPPAPDPTPPAPVVEPTPPPPPKLPTFPPLRWALKSWWILTDSQAYTPQWYSHETERLAATLAWLPVFMLAGVGLLQRRPIYTDDLHRLGLSPPVNGPLMMLALFGLALLGWLLMMHYERWPLLTAKAWLRGGLLAVYGAAIAGLVFSSLSLGIVPIIACYVALLLVGLASSGLAMVVALAMALMVLMVGVSGVGALVGGLVSISLWVVVAGGLGRFFAGCGHSAGFSLCAFSGALAASTTVASTDGNVLKGVGVGLAFVGVLVLTFFARLSVEAIADDIKGEHPAKQVLAGMLLVSLVVVLLDAVLGR